MKLLEQTLGNNLFDDLQIVIFLRINNLFKIQNTNLNVVRILDQGTTQCSLLLPIQFKRLQQTISNKLYFVFSKIKY